MGSSEWEKGLLPETLSKLLEKMIEERKEDEISRKARVQKPSKVRMEGRNAHTLEERR